MKRNPGWVHSAKALGFALLLGWGGGGVAFAAESDSSSVEEADSTKKVVPLPPAPRPPLPDILPFGSGELLEFSIDYGIVNAGGATMEVGEVRRVSGRPCFDIRTEAKSNRVFSKIYKVWDRSQTFLDRETLLPLRYEKRQREGTYKKDILVKFDRERKVATYGDGAEAEFTEFAQDELSAFYAMRLLPLEVGKDLFIDTHTNKKNYPLQVMVQGRESVTVPAGTFDCYVIEPVVREGGIFAAKGKLTIWVTADDRKLPVLMKTKIVVGSISASLVNYREGELTPRLVDSESPSKSTPTSGDSDAQSVR